MSIPERRYRFFAALHAQRFFPLMGPFFCMATPKNDYRPLEVTASGFVSSPRFYT